MKILFITDSGILGGAAKSLIELVCSLHDMYTVDITVCTSEWNELNLILEEYGIKSITDGHMSAMEVTPPVENSLIRFNIRLKQAIQYRVTLKRSIKRLEKELDLKSFDLIHTNSSRVDFGCYLSKKYHIPHVMHLREFGEEDFNCWCLRPFYYKHLNKEVTSFIAISEAVKKAWIQKGIGRNKIKVIYNGIDFQKIKKVNPKEQMENVELKLVAAGGIFPTKGQYQIVEAIGRLPKDIRNNVSLAMYGWSDRNHIREIRHRAAKLGIGSQVKWYGAKNDVYNILCQYHVGLTCSKSEGFGRVTAEYMHVGLAVIVSDTGANPELIHDGKTGLVYHLDDYEDLASKIEKYYRDREFLVSSASEAQKYAEEHYTKELNAGNIYQLYQKLTGN